MVKALILDSRLTESILAQRRARGQDRWDEVWDGVWHMAPAPNIEHQRIEAELLIVFKEVVERGGLGLVFHEVNVADRERGMEDFRIPDLVVVLPESRAQVRETFIAGGPDFIVEIHSPGDETYEKLPWYAGQGVREALIIHRDSKAQTLYRLEGGQLIEVASSPVPVESELLPLRFELLEESGNPRLRISHQEGPESYWEI
jgi:Uma2 family endonuclease